MEIIGLNRILPENLKTAIYKRVHEYVGDSEYKLNFGTVIIKQDVLNEESIREIIIETICEYHNVPRDMLFLGRKQPYTFYKHCIIYFIDRFMHVNLLTAARMAGLTTHSSALHAIKTVNNYISTDKDKLNDIQRLDEMIRAVLTIRKKQLKTFDT